MIRAAAGVLGVHKHTVSRWIAAGLPTTDAERPLLIRGQDIRAYLRAREPIKQKCPPGEFYCLSCRTPKRPAFDMAQYIPRTASPGLLCGFCSTCDRMIYRAVQRVSIEQMPGGLDISFPTAERRIGDSAEPLSKCCRQTGWMRMTKFNAANERVKHRYLHYLKDVKGRDDASIDGAAKAIHRFEEYAKHRDFKKFHIERARGFKVHLVATRNERTGEPLSASTIHSTLAALKAFFSWLAQLRGCRARIDAADVEYFNAPDNLSRVATARRYKACPTTKQVRAMIEAIPMATEIQQRDRALIAFALLSGARDRAMISFKLKHIDVEKELIEQDAREVRTKRAKTFTSWFFPVGDDFRKIFVDWVGFLRGKGFGSEDPLFPKSKGSRRTTISSFARSASIGRIGRTRTRFGRSFARPALSPACLISIRIRCGTHLVQLAYELKLDAERFKAWSQNLGHESCLTTFSSYGQISTSSSGGNHSGALVSWRGDQRAGRVAAPQKAGGRNGAGG